MNMRQDVDHMVYTDQVDYTNSLTMIELSNEILREKYKRLNCKEKSLLRQRIGQLNWLVCVSA